MMAKRLARLFLGASLVWPYLASSAPFLADMANRLAAQRAEIEKDRKALNAECESVATSHTEKVMVCQLWRDDVAKRMQQYKKEYRDLEIIREAVAGERDFFNSIQQDDIRVPLGILILAKKLRWPADKQERLERALKDIGFEDQDELTAEKVQEGWQAVWKNADDKALIRAADRAGPHLNTVSQQHGNDCAVAAMATASGLPYDDVAKEAKRLIQQGEWRHQAVRDDPQNALKQGLNGGEVILLAESLGKVEVVPSTKFQANLKRGQPVMVNVATVAASSQPRGAEQAPALAGHQVVLTKTFRNEGKTWYEMADTRYPDSRFFITPEQLNLIIQEKGIAYSRDKTGR